MSDKAKTSDEQVTFTTLLLSLISSTLVHLGELPHPETNIINNVDLFGAKQSIDTLSVLAEKTRGNLNLEEEKLFTHLLTEVKMHYVVKSKHCK